MTDEEKLQEFTQQVYLTIYGRRMDDIVDEDGVEAVAKTIIWANLFLDELEMEIDPDGTPTNWIFLRENDKELGVISAEDITFDLPTGGLRLVSDVDRPLFILQDGSVISTWDVVDPNQITKRGTYMAPREQRVTYVNQKVVFSRPLNSTEVGGTAHADIMNSFPRLKNDDTTLFNLPLPRQLLVLGAAKNASLPDIVQGGLSPSYAQKYANLLDGAKAANGQTSVADEAGYEDYSGIGGVW